MADAFPQVKKEYMPERSIAAIYIECGLVEEGIAMLIKWTKDARDHPKHELSQFFFANFILAESYIKLEKLQEAEAAFQAAVEIRPQLEDEAFIKEQYRDLLISRAANLVKLGRLQDAVDAYNEARTADDVTLDNDYLDDMFEVYNDSNDPDGLKGLDIVKSWTSKERLSWFDFFMDLGDSESIIRIFKAGKTAGELDVLLGWIEEFKNSGYVKPESAGMFFCQKTLADIHYRIINNPAAAKEIYASALNMDIKIFGGGLILDRSEARLSLASIAFDEFRQSTDPHRKVELFQTLKTHLLKGGNDIEIEDANAVVMLANMARTVGSPLEFQSFLERGFNQCYENLTDSKGWNDQPSFRLLARILACVPGLEQDALIAYSCQFYEVNRNIKDWKEDGSESSESAAEPDEYFQYSQPSAKVDSQTKAPQDPADAADGAVSENITTSVTVTETQASAISTDLDKHLVILTKEVEVAVKTTITETASPAPKPYDLSPYASVVCRGRCKDTHDQKGYKNWDEPVYLCIVCPNCDLCAACRVKRLEMSSGEGTYWRDFCGRGHPYLGGPIEGWQGVRDGMVHVGGRSFRSWAGLRG